MVVGANDELGQRLLPPPPPAYPPPPWLAPAQQGVSAAVVVVAGAWIVLAGPYLLDRAAYFPESRGVLLALMTGGLAILAFWFQQRASYYRATARAFLAYNAPIFQRAEATWGKLYFCPTCDGVFEPRAGATLVPTPSQEAFWRFLCREERPEAVE